MENNDLHNVAGDAYVIYKLTKDEEGVLSVAIGSLALIIIILAISKAWTVLAILGAIILLAGIIFIPKIRRELKESKRFYNL